jgi:hypothetical protein
MIIHKQLIQGSDEWLQLRKGKLTCSKATAIGNSGAGLLTYVKEKVLEIVLPNDNEERYTNADIERGNALEPIARAKYEFEYGVTVEEVGFVEYCPNSGFSPDGLVGEDGGIEIKARNNAKHLEHLLGATIDSSTNWQIQGSLFMSGRKWWDFISYNPNFKNSLYVERIYPDPKLQAKFKAGLAAGIKMLNDFLENDNMKKELSDAE